MFRRSVLIVAFILCLPILWQALVTGSASLETAGIRFLIAVPVAAILVGLVRWAARRHDDDGAGTDPADPETGAVPPGATAPRPR